MLISGPGIAFFSNWTSQKPNPVSLIYLLKCGELSPPETLQKWGKINFYKKQVAGTELLVYVLLSSLPIDDVWGKHIKGTGTSPQMENTKKSKELCFTLRLHAWLIFSIHFDLHEVWLCTNEKCWMFIALVNKEQAEDGWFKVLAQYHPYKDFLATLSPN